MLHLVPGRQCKPRFDVFLSKPLSVMKRYLPHLFYIAAIATAGLFYGQRLQSDNQRIALLNHTTDETIATVEYSNGELKKRIRKSAEEYPSPKNDGMVTLAFKADSLIRASHSDAALRDTLSSRLRVMNYYDRGIVKAYQTLLPSKKQVDFLSGHQCVLSQNDSLRTYWAFSLFLNICSDMQGNIPPHQYTYFYPGVSHSIWCQPAGQYFETDVALYGFARTDMIRLIVDGQTLPVKEDLARFKHTYTKPGVYPLHVKSEYTLGRNDTLRVSEKIFYLHVNN